MIETICLIISGVALSLLLWLKTRERRKRSRGYELNMTVQALDPSGINWDGLVENHIGPAMENMLRGKRPKPEPIKKFKQSRGRNGYEDTAKAWKQRNKNRTRNKIARKSRKQNKISRKPQKISGGK